MSLRHPAVGQIAPDLVQMDELILLDQRGDAPAMRENDPVISQQWVRDVLDTAIIRLRKHMGRLGGEGEAVAATLHAQHEILQRVRSRLLGSPIA